MILSSKMLVAPVAIATGHEGRRDQNEIYNKNGLGCWWCGGFHHSLKNMRVCLTPFGSLELRSFASFFRRALRAHA